MLSNVKAPPREFKFKSDQLDDDLNYNEPKVAPLERSLSMPLVQGPIKTSELTQTERRKSFCNNY